MTKTENDRLAAILGPLAHNEVVTTVRSAPAEIDRGNTYFRDRGFELWFEHHVHLVAGFNITGAARSGLSIPKTLALRDQSALVDREFSFHIGCKSYFESSLAIFPGWFDISPNELLLQRDQNFAGVITGKHPGARLHLKLFFRRPVQ